MTGPRCLHVPVNMRSIVRQEVLTNTCTKVASSLANVTGITASTRKFCVLAVMPVTLARLLATFVHVFVSTSCRTSLRMYFVQIKIKEALHNKWENPILNQQLRHLDLALSF